jgi:hypothetical protein
VGVGLGVIGLDVGEAVGGTSVGSVSPCLVGGKVEVTKTTGASVGVSLETWPQAVRSKRRKKASVIFFVMQFCCVLVLYRNWWVINPFYGLAKLTV